MKNELSTEQIAWIIECLHEYAREAVAEARKDKTDLYASGRAEGLFEAVDLIKNRMYACGLDDEDMKEFGLEMDLDIELPLV